MKKFSEIFNDLFDWYSQKYGVAGTTDLMRLGKKIGEVTTFESKDLATRLNPD